MDNMLEKRSRATRTRKSENVRTLIADLGMIMRPKIDPDMVAFTTYVANDVPDDLLLIADDIRDILHTLTGNALAKTSQGRVHVHIEIERGEAESILHIIVADTGEGIDGHTLANILHKRGIMQQQGLFPDTTRQNTGLTHIYKILNANTAKLDINTAIGRGTEFKISIPVKRASDVSLANNEEIVELEELWRNGPEPDLDALTPSRQQPCDVFAADDTSPISDYQANTRAGFSRRKSRRNTNQETNISFADMRILVVEDIIANQEVLRSLLEPAGCIVSIANNGQEAVDMTNVQIFDAVLMDIRMPIMNGVIATEIIRRTDTPNKDIPIIALTADASEENNAHCLAAGADVFLTKPVVISELFSAIRYACSQRERRESGAKQEQHAQSA